MTGLDWHARRDVACARRAYLHGVIPGDRLRAILRGAYGILDTERIYVRKVYRRHGKSRIPRDRDKMR